MKKRTTFNLSKAAIEHLKNIALVNRITQSEVISTGINELNGNEDYQKMLDLEVGESKKRMSKHFEEAFGGSNETQKHSLVLSELTNVKMNQLSKKHGLSRTGVVNIAIYVVNYSFMQKEKKRIAEYKSLLKRIDELGKKFEAIQKDIDVIIDSEVVDDFLTSKGYLEQVYFHLKEEIENYEKKQEGEQK